MNTESLYHITAKHLSDINEFIRDQCPYDSVPVFDGGAWFPDKEEIDVYVAANFGSQRNFCEDAEIYVLMLWEKLERCSFRNTEEMLDLSAKTDDMIDAVSWFSMFSEHMPSNSLLANEAVLSSVMDKMKETALLIERKLEKLYEVDKTIVYKYISSEAKERIAKTLEED